MTGMRLRHMELTPNFALRTAVQVRCAMHLLAGMSNTTILRSVLLIATR